MSKSSDEAIIIGFRSRNKEVLNYIYRSFQPMIRAMVTAHSGTEADAEDLFQDGLDLMWRKVNDESFSLTSGFGTYFYAVCHNLWMKKLRRRKQWEGIVASGRISEPLEDYTRILDEDIELLRDGLYRKHFLMLGDKCRELLTLFIQKVPHAEISKKMGHGSENYTKKLKYVCKERLIENIRNDPDFKLYHYEDND